MGGRWVRSGVAKPPGGAKTSGLVSSVLFPLVLFALYFAVQLWLLPRLGVPT